MRKRLVLLRSSGNRRGRRKVRALEIVGCKVGDTVANGRRKLLDGLLDLCRVVIRLRVVNICYPLRKGFNKVILKEA